MTRGNTQRVMSAHEAELARQTDSIVFFKGVQERLSELVTHLRGMAVNDILADETAVIGVDGRWTKDFTVPYAALAIFNFATSPIVVASGPPQTAAPSGPGSRTVAAGGGAVINLTGRALTIYGPAGAQVSVEALARPQPPSFSAGTTVSTALSAQALSDFLESVTPLAGGATFAGAAHDTSAGAWGRARAFASSDVAGTLAVDQSRDGVTWYEIDNAPLAAGSNIGTILEVPIALRFVRVRVVNGVGAQATFECDLTLVAIL
ncbi:MAG: hypothetical protein JWP02_1510 [Acidimicrobiales bacterium]|nr:hypothetical protein [Acidimicrobiales bacterium]